MLTERLVLSTSFSEEPEVSEPVPAMLRNLWMRPLPSWDGAGARQEKREAASQRKDSGCLQGGIY